jgi:hypothetical protein
MLRSNLSNGKRVKLTTLTASAKVKRKQSIISINNKVFEICR